MDPKYSIDLYFMEHDFRRVQEEEKRRSSKWQRDPSQVLGKNHRVTQSGFRHYRGYRFGLHN